MDDFKFSCTVKRSRRKTISLQITPEGNLIIRAPLHMGDDEVLAFARKHRDWVSRKSRQMRDAWEGSEHEKKLTMSEIKKLAEEAKDYIPMRAAHYAALMGVDFNRIAIRNQTTRWGSCSSRRNLNFNCLLMLTPPDVIDSVIVHELCHLRHMNHSKAFYDEVLKYFPDYWRCDRWLKENGEAIMRRQTTG